MVRRKRANMCARSSGGGGGGGGALVVQPPGRASAHQRPQIRPYGTIATDLLSTSTLPVRGERGTASGRRAGRRLAGNQGGRGWGGVEEAAPPTLSVCRSRAPRSLLASMARAGGCIPSLSTNLTGQCREQQRAPLAAAPHRVPLLLRGQREGMERGCGRCGALYSRAPPLSLNAPAPGPARAREEGWVDSSARWSGHGPNEKRVENGGRERNKELSRGLRSCRVWLAPFLV